MSETYLGEFRDGVVVFEGTPPALPTGTRVRIVPVEVDVQSTPTLAERLKSVIGIAKGLPVDLAEQHDHYIHGTPKR
jgi:hypothetical protein